MAEALGNLTGTRKKGFRQEEDELLAAIAALDIDPALVPVKAISQRP
ncbi:MAG: hypothetical protein ACD_87C00083G0002 [uncultured bacterium]|nr:MAG: hypothetical protein ACD_87C00083G0002 [uncultured bacterium]